MSRLSRREMVKSMCSVGSGLAMLGAGGLAYGTRLETEWLELERLSIPIDHLPTALVGFRIVLLSDFHLYPHTRLELIERAVETARKLKPDLVALTGDFVQNQAEAIFDLAPVLARLEATHGVFSVLGNHDHWKGPGLIRNALNRQGLTVLHNQGHYLSHGNSLLYLAGLDDAWAGSPNLEAALDRHREKAPCILLAHEPDPAGRYSLDERVTLQLSGHSHGGQVRFPLLGPPFLPPLGRRYDMGLYRVRRTWLYVNRGIGVTVPIRINCRPEVTELTLVRTTTSDLPRTRKQAIPDQGMRSEDRVHRSFSSTVRPKSS